MKVSIKQFICLGCLSMAVLLFGMEQQSKEYKLKDLLGRQKRADIASLLWESTNKPEEFKSIIAFLKGSENKQLNGSIAQAILSKANSLCPNLFKNLIVQYQVFCKHKLSSIAISPHLDYLCGLSYDGGSILFCWDIREPSIGMKPCYRVKDAQMPYDKRNFVLAGGNDCLIYEKDDHIFRHTMSTGKIIDIERPKGGYSFEPINGQFILFCFAGNHYEIRDFEKTERAIPLDSKVFLNYGQSIHVSPNNKFLVTDSGASIVNLDTGKVISLDVAMSEDTTINGPALLPKNGYVSTSGITMPSVADMLGIIAARSRSPKFSKDGRFLITSIGTKIFVWSLESDEPKNIMQMTANKAIFCGLSQEYILLLENVDGQSEKSISVIDLNSNIVLKSSSIGQYELSSDGRYLALVSGKKVMIYDLQTKSYTKELLFDSPIRSCTISSHGAYIAVHEDDEDKRISVYSAQSDGCIMRFQRGDTMKYYFYDNDERYLIGESTTKPNRIIFRNVATGRYIGAWSPKENEIYYIHGNGSSPEAFLTYCNDTKTLSLLKMADVIAFDEQFNSLNSIEKALELALIQKKNEMVWNNQKLFQCCRESEIDLNRISEPCILERLYAYDECIEYLRAQLDEAQEVSVGEPAAKKKKIEATPDWLVLKQLQLNVDHERWKLFVQKAQACGDKIPNIKELFVKYCTLKQAGFITGMPEISSQLFTLYMRIKDMIPTLTADSVLPEKYWQKQALEYYLSNLLAIEGMLNSARIENLYESYQAWQLLVEKAGPLKCHICNLNDLISQFDKLSLYDRKTIATTFPLSEWFDMYYSNKEIFLKLGRGQPIVGHPAWKLDSFQSYLYFVPRLEEELKDRIAGCQFREKLCSRPIYDPFKSSYPFDDYGSK